MTRSSPFRGKAPRALTLDELEVATYVHGQAWGRVLSSSDISEVYWGRIDGWEVAIKRFRCSSKPSQRHRDLFVRTVTRIPVISSPHVASLVGYCAEAGAVVYEFVPGTSLEGRIFGKHVAEDAMRWRERIHAITGASAGLAALHAAGISHGDLHPGSVIVSHAGHAVLVGWAGDLIGESLVGAGGYHGRVMMRNDKRGWSCVSPEGLHRAPALLAASRTAVGHGHLRGGYEENEDETPLDHPREALRMRSLGTEPSGDIWAMGVIMWEVLLGKRLVDTLWVQETSASPEESLDHLRRRKRVVWEMNMARMSWAGWVVHMATMQWVKSPAMQEVFLALGFEAPSGHRVEYTVVPNAASLAHLDHGWRQYGATKGLADPKAGKWDHEGVRYVAHCACQCLRVAPQERPTAADVWGRLLYGDGEFRLPWYGAVVHAHRIVSRVVRGVLWVFESLMSVFQLVLLLPRLGLWFLSLALRFLRFVLFLVAQLHSLLMAAVGVVIGLSEGLRGVLLGVGVEYRLPRLVLTAAIVIYLIAKIWSRYYMRVEGWLIPVFESLGHVLWGAHSLAAWVEGLIRKIMPGILGGYTVFQTGEEGALGLIPITEPLKRMLRLP